MKLYRLFPALMLAGTMIALTGCDEDPVLPPMIVPESDLQPNTTILDLKTKYWDNERNFIKTVELTESGDHVIIRGRVTSSDESGNFFKYLTIQDETAALCFSIDAYDTYQSYHYGQEVAIDMTGMEVGKYSSEFLVGKAEWYEAQSVWEAGRMELATMNEHAEINGLPDPDKVTPLTMTIDQIQAIADNSDDMRLYGHRLVRIDGVEISGAGKPLATYQKTGWHTLTDASGNELVLPVSGYCDYWSENTPSGTGSVVGILCYKYNANERTTNWQLWTRSFDDFIGFDGSSDQPVTPPTPAEAVTSFNIDFEGISDISGLPGWTKAEVKGNKDWYFTTFQENTYAAITAYKGSSSDGYEAWLISAPLNVDAMKEKVLSFDTQARYSGSDELKVFAMTSADPTAATLTELPAQICAPSGASGSDWVNSGAVSLANLKGIVYIGFRYTAQANQSGYVTYGLDNVVAGSKTDDNPPTPPTPSTGDGTAAAPYSVSQVRGGATGSGVWVTGYIVGCVNVGNNYAVESAAPFGYALNVIIAPDPSNLASYITVQLPYGDIRNAVNLKDNAGNLGKQISICGDIATYLGRTGIKNCTAYVWGATGGDTPSPDPTPGPDPDPTPGPTGGDGSAANPYTVDDINTFNIPDKNTKYEGKWVVGYIVGTIKGQVYTDGATFSDQTDVNTNLLLAASPDETDAAKCIPIALPAGDIRAQLNLMDHPEFYKKQVALFGDVMRYFATDGLKNVSKYVWGDKGSE